MLLQRGQAKGQCICADVDSSGECPSSSSLTVEHSAVRSAMLLRNQFALQGSCCERGVVKESCANTFLTCAPAHLSRVKYGNSKIGKLFLLVKRSGMSVLTVVAKISNQHMAVGAPSTTQSHCGKCQHHECCHAEKKLMQR